MRPAAHRREPARSTSRTLPSEQSARAIGDDRDHRQKQNDVGEIGEQNRAEGMDERNYEAADEGSEQAAATAEDNHDQRERQHVRVEPWISRHDRPGDDTTGSGERSAETEHEREQ